MGVVRAFAGVTTEEFSRLAREMDFSGVVSIATLDDSHSLGLAFGYADWGHRVPNKVDTRFAMGSGCKLFTAAAVGLLIEEGKLALDTRLADCVRSREFHFGRDVTIAQLLNHSSGIPDYFSEETESDYAALFRERPSYHMTSVRDFLPLFENAPMKAAPGRGFLYSNAGFVLLGFVVEELTGRDFRDFIAERIFRPCGMTRTGYYAMDALPENTAQGYVSRGADGWRTNIFSVASVGGADGGAFTTVGDLRLFWTAFLDGKILARKTADRFLTPSVPVPERGDNWHYGYGVWLRQERGSWVANIEGGDPGASLESHVRLNTGPIITVISNTGEGADLYWKLVEKFNAAQTGLAAQAPGGALRPMPNS